MFKSFRKFLSEVLQEGEQPRQFEADDYRLAAAALLVHAATVDGKVSADEERKLHTLIRRRFQLDDAEADQLVVDATDAEHQAIDLYRFTSVLIRLLNEDGRRRVVEMMWEMVYADGNATEFERNLIWRAADLLAVASRDRIELGRRVALAREADRT